MLCAYINMESIGLTASEDLFGNPNDAFFSRRGSYKSGVKGVHITWTCLRQYMFRARGSILGPPDTGYMSMIHTQPTL